MTSDMPVMLITGTSRGIGRYLAEYYLEKGWYVIGCARNAGVIDHACFKFFKVDLTDEKSIDKMFSGIRKSKGKINAVINNAGIASMNLLNLTPYETARKIFSVNVMGSFSILQKSVRFLKKTDNPRIVNFSTVAVPLRLAGESIYAASKSAVETMTRILAKELSGMNITCNAIGPAPIQTDLIKGVGTKRIKALLDKLAIKRLAEFKDVSNVIDFFIAPESGMVTGQVIYLGGVG